MKSVGGPIDRGRRHQLLSGGTYSGPQTYLPPKFYFSSDFGHFILKILGENYFSYDLKKCKKEISGWTSPIIPGWGEFEDNRFIRGGAKPLVLRGNFRGRATSNVIFEFHCLLRVLMR